MSPEYRDRLIKRGQNQYVAPEVIEGKDFDSQIDIFSLGVCLFYMVFQKFPYQKIEKIGEKWTYELDISILEQMFNEKKKDPSSHQHLSVSGIDFLLKLLQKDPEKRPTAQNALNHHWFINFTNKPTDNKKLQKFRESHQMTSLKTILECSELSEREIESSQRIIFRRPLNSNLSIFTDRNNHGDDLSYQINEEENVVNQLMRNLETQSKPKQPSKYLRNQITAELMHDQQSPQQIQQLLMSGKRKSLTSDELKLRDRIDFQFNLPYNDQEYVPSSPTYLTFQQKNSFGLDVITEDTSEVGQPSLKSLTSKNRDFSFQPTDYTSNKSN